MSREDKLADKINKLNETFEQADIVCSDELVEYLDAKQSDIVKMSDNGTKDIVVDGEVIMSRAEVIKLQVMVDDYKEMHSMLKDTNKTSKQLLDSLAVELMDEDCEDYTAKLTVYTGLYNSITQSTKAQSASYKDISTVLLNLDKLDKGKDPKLTINGDVNIKTEQTNNVVSTVDLIKQLKDKNGG